MMTRSEAIQAAHWLKKIEPRRRHIGVFKSGKEPPKGGTVDQWEEYYKDGWEIDSQDVQLHRIMP